MADYDITAKGTALEFDTDHATFNASCKIDATHAINFWNGSSGYDGYVQVFEMDGSTFAVTAKGTALEFDTDVASYISCGLLDSTHVIAFWAGTGSDGYVQVFEINLTTYAVTAKGSPLEFDTGNATYNSCAVLDSTHAINFWRSSDYTGYCQVFEVDGSYNVTAKSTALNFDAASGLYMSCAKIDSTHAIAFWGGSGSDGYTQVFTINDSTYAVTAEGSALEFDTTNGTHNSCAMLDSTHAINFWAGTDYDGYVQVFEIDGSYNVTAKSSALEFDTTNGAYNACAKIDSTHTINFWAGADNDGYTQVFTIDSSTYAVTAEGSALEFDTTNGTYNACAMLDSNHAINFWSGTDSDGYAQAFEIEIPASGDVDQVAGVSWDNVDQIAGIADSNISELAGVTAT